MDMMIDQFEPSDAALDRQIEGLVGKQVRGELTEEERVMLIRLIARQSRNMRPSRMTSGRFYARRSLVR